MTLIDFKKVIADEKINFNVSRRLVSPVCIAGVLTSHSEFQRPVRPDEVVIATKQLQVIFETLLPSNAAYRPPKNIRRALPDRQIQPFDERRVS